MQETPLATAKSWGGGGGRNDRARLPRKEMDAVAERAGSAAVASAGRHRGRALFATVIIAASLTLTAAASLAVDTPSASVWQDGDGPQLLPLAAAESDWPPLEREGGADAVQPALHRPAKLHLHPSTLALSGYPPVGGGTAELVFTVTYAGDMRQDGGAGQGPAEPPVVRLDVTGSGYPDLYRVTNIVSNIGTAAPDIFEPYDHESETVRAERGVTYTVRATVEFVAEGFIPVYARGFDGDIVTVDVTASKLASMPHSAYVAAQQDYLDSVPAERLPSPAHAGAPSPEKRRAADPLAQHPPTSSLPSSTQPLAESAMQPTFVAIGTVMAENYTGQLLPVHGIWVCVYDRTPTPLYDTPFFDTLLYTSADEPACGYTDTDGRYEISNVARADPYDMTSADVIVSVLSYGYGGVIDLEWYNKTSGGYYIYYKDSEEQRDYDDAVLDYDFNLRDGNIEDAEGMFGAGMAGAARTISAISDGMAFFEAIGQDPADLTVRWNYNSGSSVFPATSDNGAEYYPQVAGLPATIYMDGNDGASTYDESYDRHTILHEFGHHVHFTHDPEFQQDCSSHSIHKKYDEACAWGEGWANLVPHLVDGSAEVPIWVGGFKINIEASRIIRPNGEVLVVFKTFEASGRPVGEKVEGSVTAAMWDMTDSLTDRFHDASLPGRPAGGDNSSAGVNGLLDVFFAGSYDNFGDFYDRWEIDMRHDSAESIAILHGMSFAIPSNMSYYGFAGELGGVFKYAMSVPSRPDTLSDLELDTWRSEIQKFRQVYKLLQFKPNYVAVSSDGSTVAVTSDLGHGLQMVDARTGEHKGLYATHGHNHACTLEEDWHGSCTSPTARAEADRGPSKFSSMDGIAFGLDSSVVLVSDRHQNRVQIIGSDGEYLGAFGTKGSGNGEFSAPYGLAFLANGTTVAVADGNNSRIQLFGIFDSGSAQYADQFESYKMTDDLPSAIWQQLAAGPNGTLYAAGSEPLDNATYPSPRIWKYPSPHGSSPVTRIDDPSLGSLGGIAADRGGLIYVSDVDQGRIRVYDPANLRGTVDYSSLQIGDRSVTIHGIVDATDTDPNVSAEAFIDEFGSSGRHTWQLEAPRGVALGPPDGPTGDVRIYVAGESGVKMFEKDREEPRVESMWAHTADKTVVQGETIEIAVNFTERVTVTGTPVLALETGVAGSSAAYVSGSGSRTLTFNYTVNASAAPSYIDYAGTDSLSLGDGGSAAKIVDGSGNAANLTLPDRGTAGSLAANAALWIDASTTGRAPFSIAALATVEAVENRQVGFDVSTTGATPGSYSLIDAPAGATISPSGAFAWTPGEAQDGVHAFVVKASAAGDPSMSHARTFRIAVAEDNAAPVIAPVPDMRAFAAFELRFDIAATDGDLPAQTLAYCLGSNKINFAAVLPNGTFVWTPSKYNMGTTSFNVSVADGFACNDWERNPEASIVFNVTVVPKPPSVYALAPDGPAPVYTAGQAVRIAAEFTEPVAVQVGSGGGAPYLELRTGAAGARAPYVSGSGTSTLVFAYTVRDGDSTDRLSYNGTGALALNGSTITAVSSGDPASTVLAEPGSADSLSNSSLVRIDALRPTVVSVYAPAGDGVYSLDDQIDIAARFSENVTVAGTPAITLETGPTDRDAAYRSGNATDTLVFRYTVQEGDIASRLDYTGTDALKAGDGASIVDAVGNAAVLTLAAPGSEGSLGNSAIVSIGDGMGGPATNNVTVNIGPSRVDGSGNVTSRGDEARVMINVESLARPGGAGTATFPPGGAVVRTSFASVSFPPGVTATSVPADGLLSMYVADDAIDNSSVQGALGYDGSGPVVLRRVVEIGDEDSRIVFDMPVRISLEGQASGRAFYAAGAGGAIMPIDRACAADDTERVHRQLDRTGECQIDADGDKVVYTYHLTRFGTAMSGSGAPPPVNHTCSMRIASADLDVRVSPNSLSTAAPQSVINSGSLPFDSVGLEASPWYINLGSAQPGPDTPSLPASITMVSEAGDNGPYRQVNASGTGVAEDLGGGQQASLWFKMDLRGQDGPQSGNLVQNVAYVAECVG